MNINMPTSLAGGRYQLGQLVGRGGMAEVHVATDTRLGRTVAVKIMRADFATDSIFLERFRREAHSVAQMNNPNIRTSTIRARKPSPRKPARSSICRIW